MNIDNIGNALIQSIGELHSLLDFSSEKDDFCNLYLLSSVSRKSRSTSYCLVGSKHPLKLILSVGNILLDKKNALIS